MREERWVRRVAARRVAIRVKMVVTRATFVLVTCWVWCSARERTLKLEPVEAIGTTRYALVLPGT